VEVVKAGGSEENPAEFLHSLLETVPAFITHLDPELRIRYINVVQPGLRPGDVIGASVFDFIAEEFRDVARACFARVQRTGQTERYLSDATGPHGGLAHYENHVSAVREKDGRCGLCIVGIDVTEHRRRDDALRESEELLRLAVEASGMGIWSWVPTTKEMQWDEQMQRICGVTGSLSFEEYVERLVHPEDQGGLDARRRMALESGEFPTGVYRIVRPDSETRWVLSVGRVVKSESGEVTRVIGGLMDVTDQHALEDRTRHAQKLEAVGTLTAGVAHNFNNMLMVIQPSLDLIAASLPADEQPVLKDAIDATERAVELVRGLMTFAGQSAAGPLTDQGVAGIIEEAVRICRRTFDPQIVLRSSAEPGLVARCDANGLVQVLMNLLLNSRDALTEGERDPREAAPEIRVTARRVQAAPRANRTASAHARIDVADNGPGMSEAIRARVFQPFFTTKTARGTGLGLATSFAIIRDFGGWMECDSRLGKGTTVSIYLPLSRGRAGERKGDAESVAAPPGGGRVLVIDDERAVRNVVSLMLRRAGYQVTTAEDSVEASAVLASGSVFDLVLLDRSLPGRSGPSLVGELRDWLPRAKILFFSGEFIDESQTAQVDGYIQKPVARDALLAAVARAIGLESGV
jgi:PAS domain S-box-containing protein